jgi:hypothetical protein
MYSYAQFAKWGNCENLGVILTEDLQMLPAKSIFQRIGRAYLMRTIVANKVDMILLCSSQRSLSYKFIRSGDPMIIHLYTTMKV